VITQRELNNPERKRAVFEKKKKATFLVVIPLSRQAFLYYMGICQKAF
jgi:hypothetical protein